MFHMVEEMVDAGNFSGEIFPTALPVITERVMGSGNSNEHGYGVSGRSPLKHIANMSIAFDAGVQLP